MICPSCGEDNPERFRWCGFCGAELTIASASPGRKVVTLVFADVTGSTALGERLDAESVRWVMSRFFDTARTVLEGHGGTVEKFIGDAVMAAFGIPSAREDDALRAVRAAADLRDRLHELGREVEERYGTGIGVRIGVNTGEVVAGDAAARQAFASGDAVNVAARLEQAAAPGEVLLGEATLRLVRDAVVAEELEPLVLKGKTERVPAWRLVAVSAGAPGVLRRFDAPLIGREHELALLSDEWRRAVERQETRVATVVAAAGTGKTRLLAELVDTVRGEAQVLLGSCLAYGEGITYWPIAEAIRAAAEIEANDSADEASAKLAALLEGEEAAADIQARLGHVLGTATSQSSREETFWAVRTLFEALARRRSLVVILDDLHWAEETLVDLIDYLAGWTRGVPLLIVCATRPELLERRPAGLGASPHSRTILLEALDDAAADELMLWQLGSVPLPRALRDNVLATSAGNPLYVQELLRMLIEDGLVVRRNGGWHVSGGIEKLAMPPTIQALLTARLDQLGPAERDVAQRASVVGHVFSRRAVQELCDLPIRTDASAHLQTLTRKELITRDGDERTPDDAFRFGHILVRDAAYAGLAKRTRAELHERLADWTERERSGRLTEYEEILGYHLEQAAAYSRELGHGADAERVAVRASEHLAAAGRRAAASGDFPAAANLLDRAADTLPEGRAERPSLRLEAIAPLVETARFDRAGDHLDEILATTSEPRLVLAAGAWKAFLHAQNVSSDAGDACVTAAEAWLAESERTGDHASQATALDFLAKMEFWDGCAAPAANLWARAVEQAEIAGDKREESESLVWLLIVGMFGPTPVDVALERCREIAEREGASLKVRVMASIERGVLEAMQGQIERGRERVAAGREQLEALGLVHLASVMAQEATIVEQLAGDPKRAEAILLASVAAFDQMGDRGFGSTHALLLGRALVEQGRFDDATAAMAPYLEGNARFSGDADHVRLAVHAHIAAHEGRAEEALQIITEVIEAAEKTDYPRELGDCYIDLADIHALAGRHDEALAALAEADARYARKGCIAAMRWVAERRARVSVQ